MVVRDVRGEKVQLTVEQHAVIVEKESARDIIVKNLTLHAVVLGSSNLRVNLCMSHKSFDFTCWNFERPDMVKINIFGSKI